MSDLLPEAKQLPPLYVTEQELRDVFREAILANKWAADTIGDLWRMGSPHPQDMGKGHDGRRLILPTQYLKWVEDVLTKAGKPLDASAKMYIKLMGGLDA